MFSYSLFSMAQAISSGFSEDNTQDELLEYES